MQPVVTPTQMAAIDAEATEPVQVLIERAGFAVAREALRMLGGAYGRRIVVVAGPGNNGADGRVAARFLRRRGARLLEFDAGSIDRLPAADLVIDAAYGTGLGRPYDAPSITGRPLVLAVDIPSGVDGLTGEIHGAPMAADRTVTFAALKPGLLSGPGARLAGEIVVADIGLDVSRAEAALVTDADIATMVPSLEPDTHKWKRACLVIAGSPGMDGAAQLASAAAMRAGAGYVRLCSLGDGPPDPIEAVRVPLPAAGVPADLERFAAVVFGPGLGPDAGTLVEHYVRVPQPLVIDGDGLTALAGIGLEAIAPRYVPAVLTPHDGEYERLMGHRPGTDRLAAARELAAAAPAVVLLKGPTTVVAAPNGAVRLITAGPPTLGTAGTGDVLAGVIAGFVTRGAKPFDAAAAAAQVHGRAAASTPGLVASDLLATIPSVLTRRGVT
ncbi:MAG: NAD(P)H-hydrate dehydratase [Acidimicrobiales bacterium]|nr:NAD(P)H-hydrate dehydratase [Acidimicrobiales bacterium]